MLNIKRKKSIMSKRATLSQLSLFLRVLCKMAEAKVEFPIFYPETTTNSSFIIVIGQS